MDPVSIAGTLIAIIQISGKVVSLCYEYRRNVKNASAEISQLLEEVTSVRDVVERLHTVADAGEESGELQASDGIAERDTLLVRCLHEMQSLKAKLKLGKGVKGKSKLLVWPLKKKEVYESLATIGRIKATLQLALSADTITSLGEILTATRLLPSIKADVSTFARGLGLSESNARSKEILNWLSTTEYHSRYQGELQKRTPGTGKWFLDGELFKSWKNGLSGPLLLQGIPGSGKTVLSATIINDVQLYNYEVSDNVVAYFFFDSTTGTGQDCDQMIRAVLRQLASQKSAIMFQADNLYENHEGGRVNWSETAAPLGKALRKALKGMISSFDTVYLVLDALDECKNLTEQDLIVALIEDLLAQFSSKIHLLATSRPNIETQISFSNLQGGFLPLEPTQLDPDIHNFVRSRLSEDPRMRKWPSAIKREIEDALKARARGMFRLAACHLELLKECTTPAQIRHVLSTLPESLQETYRRILSSIDHIHHAMVKKLLLWLAFSIRPDMRISELAEGLAIETDSNGRPHYNVDLRLLDAGAIVDICSGLVTTVHDTSQTRHDREDSSDEAIYIRLAHFTVKEFITADASPTRDLPFYMANEGLSHAYLAQCCIAYLLHAAEGPLEKMDNDFPLLGYSASCWMPHRDLASEDHCDEVLNELLVDLFHPQSAAFELWTRLYPPERHWRTKRKHEQELSFTPLYTAACIGLEAVVTSLINQNVDLNAPSGLFGSPLNAAAYYGNISIVLHLLRAGASPSRASGQYKYALACAAHTCQEEIVRILLEHGASVDAVHFNDGRSNCLFIAARNGDAVIVRLLLDHGARDYWRMKQKPGSALHAAVMGGHIDVVRALLSASNANKARTTRGSDMSFRASQDAAAWLGRTDILRELTYHGIYEDGILNFAARAGDEEKVEQILHQHGPIISTSEVNNFQQALRIASREGQVEIVRKLLTYGTDPNMKSNYRTEYSTALLGAVRGGHGDIVDLLVFHGADVNQKLPLSTAAGEGDIEMMQILIALGADVQVQGNDAWVPAAYRGQFHAFQYLLNHGATLPQSLEVQKKLLWKAACGGSTHIIRLLFDHGIQHGFRTRSEQSDDTEDPHCHEENHCATGTCTHSETPLPVAEESLDEWDSDSGSWEQPHPLWGALMNGHASAFATLLDRGLDFDVFVAQGESVLAQAIRNRHETIVAQLLVRGADVNLQQSQDRGTPLLHAIQHEAVGLTKVLLQRGAKPMQRGTILQNQRKFPLLLACEHGNLEIVELLMRAGANVNDQDAEGFSPLHAAAGEGKDEVLRTLIEKHQADIHSLRLLNGSLPIHTAASRGNSACIEVLLGAGVAIDATNDDDRTPLHWASDHGKWDNVQYLLDRGANIHLEADDEKLFPIDFAHLAETKRKNSLWSMPPVGDWTEEKLIILFDRLKV